MENKKSGVFLGVVSIATLVVAIIGATFAYFSAQASSDTDAVQLSAYSFDAKVADVRRVYPAEAASITGLIPLQPDKIITGETTNLLYTINNPTTDMCVDSNGYQVCEVYEVTLVNDGQAPADLTFQVRTNQNLAASSEGRTPFKDLTIQSLEGEPSTGAGVPGTFTKVGTATTLLEEQDATIAVPGVTVHLGTGAENTTLHYFVVYLNETETSGNTDDQSAQMGATYTGQLIYTTTVGNGNSSITGTFTLGGDEPLES